MKTKKNGSTQSESALSGRKTKESKAKSALTGRGRAGPKSALEKGRGFPPTSTGGTAREKKEKEAVLKRKKSAKRRPGQGGRSKNRARLYHTEN